MSAVDCVVGVTVMNEAYAYHLNFRAVILQYSVASTFGEAIKEWGVVRYETEEEGVSCVCEKPGCVYVSEIGNTINGNRLYPVGSSCVRHVYGEHNHRANQYYSSWIKQGYDGTMICGPYEGMTYMDILQRQPDYARAVVAFDYEARGENLRCFQMWLRDGKHYKYFD